MMVSPEQVFAPPAILKGAGTVTLAICAASQ